MITLEMIIERCGGVPELAKFLGVNRSAIDNWKFRGLRVPPLKYADVIEAVSGIPKEEIWVDHYKKIDELKRNRRKSNTFLH